MPRVSVFTATFNRRSTIHRVYESLVQHTYRDFEWIVIDDGSEDNTGELISHYQSIENFPITCIWQKNRGKHTAYNLFAAHAKAPLYCAIDSDDAVLPNCLERMLFHLADSSTKCNTV